ncbi:MAG: leucine-rich repeat domain-containing protein [Ruminococcus flavefaciens]|nr:leucine-rich repeat domain-containing protein [Ruminococcus flavefaciens]
MPFVIGRCPKCKRLLPVDDTRETWICEYCGFKFLCAENNTDTSYDIQSHGYIIPVSKISDFVIECGVLKKYTGESTYIVIPESVTKIDDNVFEYMPIQTVTIPKSVQSIGHCAFGSCMSLDHAIIPEGINFIGNCAFSGCTSLRYVTIPKSVTSMGNGVFLHCSSLKSVIISKSVTYIGVGAFLGCKSLESVTVPENVQTIDECAFCYCKSLKSIKIPKNATISDNAFENCAEDLEIEYY